MAAGSNIPPFEDRDPVPGIPAGEGWKKIKPLLDKALPVCEPIIVSSPGKKIILYCVILATALVGAALLIYRNSSGPIPASHRFQKNTSTVSIRAERRLKGSTGNENKTRSGAPNAGIVQKRGGLKKNHTSPLNDNTVSTKEKQVITKSSINEQWRRREILPLPTAGFHDTSDIPHQTYPTFIYATIASEISDTDLLTTKAVFSLPETDSNLAAHLSDSISNRAGNKKATEKKGTGKIFKGGIQFLAPMPVYGSAYYFSGPSGDAQIYRLLVPSLWMSYAWRKNFFAVSLVPLMQNNLPDVFFKKVFRGAAPNALSDTSLTLLKYFGTGGAISFGKSIGTHLQISAGIEIAAWSKGLLKWERSGPNAAGVPYAVKKDTLYNISSQDTLWKYANSSQLGAMLEILYQKNKWQVGTKISIPLKSPINTGNTGQPLQINMFYRYALFRRTR